MGQPAAKQGDQVLATDMHLILPPGATAPVLMPHPFTGILDGSLSPDVKVMGQPAATLGSTATNTPAHLPSGGAFVSVPANRGTVVMGSTTVRVNGKPAARNGDTALTCNDPVDIPAGTVVAVGTVMIGG